MIDAEKLQQIINTGMRRKYVPDGIENVTNWKTPARNGQAWVRWFNNDGQEVIQDVEHVLFSKSFAKAFWGEPIPQYLLATPPAFQLRPVTDDFILSLYGRKSFDKYQQWKLSAKPKDTFDLTAWETVVASMTKDYKEHLQQAVTAESPIDYYFKNMEEK